MPIKEHQRLPSTDDYSFCESVHVTGSGNWHLRRLTKVGRKLGGGIDTPGLCGFPKKTYGWDLDVDLTQFHLLNNTCKECLKVYKEMLSTTAHPRTTKMSKDELVKAMIERFSSEELDEWVLELKGEEASRINNEGVEAQAKYMIEQGTQEWVEEILEHA